MARPPLLLLGLDHALPSSEMREAVLTLMGTHPDRRLIATSAIDPLHWLTARAPDTTDAQAVTLDVDVQRWAWISSTLEKIRFARPRDPGPLAVQGCDRLLLERLREECQWTDDLLLVRATLLERPDLAELDWEDVVLYVLDQMEPRYRAQWSLCSAEERLTMIQLASEGVINPRAFDVLLRLRRRRLVRTDPRFRLINESFTRFVQTAETPAQVKQWETPEPGQGWGRLRPPLLVMLFMVVAILFYTQQPYFDATMGLIAGTAGVLASLRAAVAVAQRALASQNTA